MKNALLKQDFLQTHHNNVAFYARHMAVLICPGLVDIVTEAALVHDIGKTRIEEKIVFKPGQLGEDEWKEMRRHPVIGANMIIKNMVKPLNSGRVEVSMAVLHHHERFDGTGYPDGLFGEDIPIAARIITVADAFDAMTTARTYQKARSEREALIEMVRCAGKQFDSLVVRAFLRTVNPVACTGRGVSGMG